MKYFKPVVAAGLMAPLSVMAQVDLTAATTAFGNLETALAGIGALIISASVLAVTYKWVKASIFG